MAPHFDPDSIKVVFADEFKNQQMIIESGIASARLYFDHHHLKKNLHQSIGPLYNENYSNTFNRILNASSEQEFHNLLQKARTNCKDNTIILEEFNDLVKKR